MGLPRICLTTAAVIGWPPRFLPPSVTHCRVTHPRSRNCVTSSRTLAAFGYLSNSQATIGARSLSTTKRPPLFNQVSEGGQASRKKTLLLHRCLFVPHPVA